MCIRDSIRCFLIFLFFMRIQELRELSFKLSYLPLVYPTLSLIHIYSVANVEKAAGLLDGYGSIGCFLDRDEAGRRMLTALVGRYGERVTDRSFLYDGCKDLNEYLQQTTKKQKNNHLKIGDRPR